MPTRASENTRATAAERFVLLANLAEPRAEHGGDLSDPGIRLGLVQAEQLRAVVHDPDQPIDRSEMPTHDLLGQEPLGEIQPLQFHVPQLGRRLPRDRGERTIDRFLRRAPMLVAEFVGDPVIGVAEEAEIERLRLSRPSLGADLEIEADRLPMTIYPEGHRPRVKAWVRFGPKPVRVDAVIVRTNDVAVGVEFKVRDKAYRCWVWRDAVTLEGG